MPVGDEDQGQRDQLVKLVKWCDELDELKALESFLGQAVSQVIATGGFLEGDDCVQGLHLFCRELNKRAGVLREDMYSECVRLRSELDL